MKIYYHKKLLFQEIEDKINTLEIIKSWHELSSEDRILYWSTGAFIFGNSGGHFIGILHLISV
jgi:hypothetical protein